MIIHFLRLHNFGLYGGLHEFNLLPDPKGQKPVILIKGHNGAGKTTFLEAVRLALYGKRALGPRVSQSDYEAHLIRKIHSAAEQQHAWVELEFESQHSGKKEIFSIRREWSARGTTVVEAPILLRDGQEIDNIPREDWDHYLEDLIPAGVSQLFFFDGEKIQDIADDQGSVSLFEAIRSLLGLDIVDQLRGDLALFKARVDGDDKGAKLETILRDIEVNKVKLEKQDELSASLSTKKMKLAKRSEIAQQKFQQEGGALALDRDKLKQEISSLEKNLTTQQSNLKALINGTAPFALAPKLIKAFASEVEKVKGAQFEKSVQAFVSAFQETLSIKSTKNTTWTDEHFEALNEFASAAAGADDVVELTAEPEWVLDKFGFVANDRVAAAKLSGELREIWKKRSFLKEQLKNFQAGSATTAFENLKKAEFDLGAVANELDQSKSEAERLRNLSLRLKADKTKAQEAQFDRDTAKEKMDLASRTQRALAEYEQKIVQARLKSLSYFFIQAFSGLVHRKTLIKNVEIDAETFAIKLFDENGDVLDSLVLSAGERQLYAISMLWALGKTSGRELPMIIDTPLSRLDSVHRQALMGEYLPNAGEQVIMLCTDTELTDDIEALIDPYVSRYFEIGVTKNARSTAISKEHSMTSSSDKEALIDAC